MSNPLLNWKPENNRIDYDRAGELEQAIRNAAQMLGYEIIDIHIYADNGGRPPRIEIELAQQARDLCTKGTPMSYYLGFRQGWVKLLGHGVGWYDARVYPHSVGRTVRGWKVWFQ